MKKKWPGPAGAGGRAVRRLPAQRSTARGGGGGAEVAAARGEDDGGAGRRRGWRGAAQRAAQTAARGGAEGGGAGAEGGRGGGRRRGGRRRGSRIWQPGGALSSSRVPPVSRVGGPPATSSLYTYPSFIVGRGSTRDKRHPFYRGPWHDPR